MPTTIRNQKLFCLNCGGEFALAYPIPIKDFAKKAKAFETLHKDCPATWKQPEVDQSKSIEEKTNFWLLNGEHGNSSVAMCRALMDNPVSKSHPYDPDDFRRCYLLLKAVPEWKKDLHKLKSLSLEWSNLVDNWDILTSMYEENVKTNWINYERIGMYELMQKLIKAE